MISWMWNGGLRCCATLVFNQRQKTPRTSSDPLLRIERCDAHNLAPCPRRGASRRRGPLTRARERVRNKAFIRATGYPSEPFDQGLASARAKGWRVYEIACGHDIMLDMPERLAELLQGLSR